MLFESLSFGVCVGTLGAMLLFTYKSIIGSTVHALGTNAMYGNCLGLDSRYVLEMDSGLMSSASDGAAPPNGPAYHGAADSRGGATATTIVVVDWIAYGWANTAIASRNG